MVNQWQICNGEFWCLFCVCVLVLIKQFQPFFGFLGFARELSTIESGCHGHWEGLVSE